MNATFPQQEIDRIRSLCGYLTHGSMNPPRYRFLYDAIQTGNPSSANVKYDGLAEFIKGRRTPNWSPAIFMHIREVCLARIPAENREQAYAFQMPRKGNFVPKSATIKVDLPPGIASLLRKKKISPNFLTQAAATGIARAMAGLHDQPPDLEKACAIYEKLEL